MGKIGDVITTAVPTTSTAQPGGMQQILDLLDEFKTRLTSKVQVSSLDKADQALDMNGWAVNNVAELVLSTAQDVPSGAPYGRWVRYGGNVYWVDVYGAVQVTNGATVNVSTTGGIVGDYGSSGRLVSYEDSAETYHFYDDQAASQYAILKARGLHVVEEISTRMVRILPSGSIAATYDLTLPTGLPAATELLELTPAGQIQKASTAAVAQFSVNAQDVKHTERTYRMPLVGWVKTAGSGTASQSTTTRKITNSLSGPITIIVDLPPLVIGKRLKSVTARALAGNITGVTLKVFKSTDDAAPTQVGTTGTLSAAGTYQTMTATMTETIAANTQYYAEVAFPTAGSILYEIGSMAYTVDYV